MALSSAPAQDTKQGTPTINTGTLPQEPTLKSRPQSEGALPHSAASSTAMKPDAAIPAKALQLYLQAIHELHQGQTSAAASDAHRAIRVDGKFADAYALAATAALVERNFSSARTQAMRAVQIDPQDEKAWVIAATADNYLSLYAEAASALSNVQQQHRTTWQVAYQWARADLGQQNGEEALEWSNRAALTAPAEFAPLHLLRASALLAVNQCDRSADELETYIQLIGPDAPQHGELVRELHRLRELAQAGNTSRLTTTGTAPQYNALAN